MANTQDLVGGQGLEPLHNLLIHKNYYEEGTTVSLSPPYQSKKARLLLIEYFFFYIEDQGS